MKFFHTLLIATGFLFSSSIYAKEINDANQSKSTQASQIKTAYLLREKTPSPVELSKQLKKSLAKVRSSCVSIYANGYGSGVIISNDGLVLTAAHMMRGVKKDKAFTITLEDKRALKARLLGYNRESDYALLKIITPTKKPLPFCEMAKTASKTGAFCFTFAHPSGILKGRPAQVRIGRITTHSMRRGKPFYLFSDLNIQPGDSGGPLFSMDGKLIGIDSSAANLLGINIFPAIDQYYLDKKRLLKKERWGDKTKAPDSPGVFKGSFDQKTLLTVKQVFMKRFRMGYPPTVDFVQSLKKKKGAVHLDQIAMIKHMPIFANAISHHQPISLGLDDPIITKQLPPIKKNTVLGATLYADHHAFAVGTIVDEHHILTKKSLLPKNGIIQIRNSEKKYFTLKVKASDATWDVALLETSSHIKFPVPKWTLTHPNVQAGDVLIAKDSHGRKIWNIATDQSRPVTKERSIGPLKDKSLISKHRAPYPYAIRNALPLFAKQAGTPVYNEKGEFVGMFIARFSRTMGLILPADKLYEVYQSMLQSPKKQTTAKTRR